MAFADTATQSHVHYRGLREWLDKVQGMGELLCVNGADWNAEMGRASCRERVSECV